ncbi:TetR/AcrR family transcriptional regulator [Desulfobacula sp.]|uniref:TetR/AcrR family transcriptional regulator n=1 Tax=Desulfobacula sp. TaxID=2593537 RepID=UPI002603A3C0|nr:TetR/AcrR family transcriptional regulator [Desulfobacula sp.]
MTMVDIAKESEFSVGTMYKFFKNKEEVYKELILKKVSEFHTALNEAIATKETEIEKINLWIKERFRMFYIIAILINTFLKKLKKIYTFD